MALKTLLHSFIFSLESGNPVTSVAIQQLSPIRARLDQEGDDLQGWLECGGIDLALDQDAMFRIPWELYTRILDLIVARRDPDWLCECGAESVYDPLAADFRRGLLLGFSSPRAALPWLCAPYGPFNTVAPFIQTTLSDEGRVPVRIVARMTSGLTPHPSHHQITRGVLMEFPRVLCEGRAHVDVEPRDDGADYLVRFARRRLLAGLRRRWLRSRPQPDYLQSVGNVYAGMIERQISLQQEQDASRETEDTLRDIVAASGDGVFRWDLRSGDINLSDRMADILQLNGEGRNVPHREVLDRVHPDDRNEAWKQVNTAIESQQALVMNCRLIGRAGDQRHVTVRLRTQSGPDGKPNCVLGTVSDVTALEQMRQDLLTAERVGRIGHFRVRFHRAGEELAVDTVSWSPEAFRLAQVEPDQLDSFRERLGQFLPEEDYVAVRKLVRLVLRDREPQDLEIRVQRMDGEQRRVHLHLVPDHGDAIFGTVQDVTEQRQQLEQLWHSQNLEMVGKIAGGVAHDFNNLLGIIRGNLELLQGSELNAQQRKSLAQGLEAADKASALTHRLVSYARKQVQQTTVVTVGDLLATVGSLMARVLPAFIKFSTHDATHNQSIRIDAQLLESCLINLIVNAQDALEASRSDDAFIRLTAEFGDGPQSVVFAVEDNGPGIAADILDRVCEPFFSTKSADQGSGMGLAMVQGFAEQNQGSLRLVSEPGRLTCVAVTLPCAVSEAPRVLVEWDDVEPSDDGACATTVLLVDDQKPLRDVAARLLVRLGYDVVTAADADAALKMVEAAPDAHTVLLTDMIMPGNLSGLDLVAQAREINPNLACVLMTGYTDGPYEMDAGRLGLRILHKPFSSADLERALTLSLREERTAALGL